MTAETIHTCSYSCERPECIRAQRDELAARLTAETSNARGATYTFDMIEDAWGDAVPLTKPYFNRFRARLETLRQSAAPPPAAEGVQAEPNAEARGVVDEAMVERAWVAFCEDTGPARAAMRAALTAALTGERNG